MRAHFDEDSARAALLLEQSAYCLLRMAPPSVRKFAFHLVLAGLRYHGSKQKRLAVHCYRQVGCVAPMGCMHRYSMQPVRCKAACWAAGGRCVSGSLSPIGHFAACGLACGLVLVAVILLARGSSRVGQPLCGMVAAGAVVLRQPQLEVYRGALARHVGQAVRR